MVLVTLMTLGYSIKSEEPVTENRTTPASVPQEPAPAPVQNLDSTNTQPTAPDTINEILENNKDRP